MALKLYPHQTKAVSELGIGKILCGQVGSGKSITALTFWWTKICDGELKPWKRPKRKVPLYIITTARKRDSLEWQEDLTYFAKDDSHLVVVDSWNNMHKYEGVRQAFFIFDEQRVVGSGAWVKSFYKITKYNPWILLSATPGDTWLDYIPVFVANGYYRNKTHFVEQHVLYSRFSKFPKVDKFVNTKKLEKFRARLLVDMPFERHTVRHRERLWVEYDRELYRDILKSRCNPWDDYKPFKNSTGLAYALRRCSNDAKYRIPECRKLIEKHKRAIIFYNFDHELDELRKLDDAYVVAEWNGHKHEKVPSGNEWVYLVHYLSGAEAWNCTDTDCIIFYSLNYSYRIMEQAEGRIDRMNTKYTDLYYYILTCHSNIDLAIWEAKKRKKVFSESAFTKRLGEPQ